jgi:hypothetical protein
VKEEDIVYVVGAGCYGTHGAPVDSSDIGMNNHTAVANGCRFLLFTGSKVLSMITTIIVI